MKSILNKLYTGQTLSEKTARELVYQIVDKHTPNEQIAAAITAFNMRPVTINEVKGFRKGLLEQTRPLSLDGTKATDVCGTGGDGKNTINISTLAAIIIAGAGYQVIKHGNYGVSSKVGSSTILESVGYKFSDDETVLNKQLDRTNLVFLHAPLFHPALKRVAGIRKAIGVPTFFNFMGPLINPVQPSYQLTGVFDLQILRLYKSVLRSERKGYGIVHSMDGYDEISLTSAFKFAGSKGESLHSPSDFGKDIVQQKDLCQLDASDPSKEFLALLSGKGNRIKSDVILTNAAFGILNFERSKSFTEAYSEAAEALYSGKALNNFKINLAISQGQHIIKHELIK